MTVLRHELRQGRIPFMIWTVIIVFMLGLCILIYPEMAKQMSELSGAFADMGGFSAAFGMDKINFGEFTGFFGVECGNILGLGGAFFAAFLGSTALAKEEKEHTAEFLFTHPVSRSKVVLQKLISVLIQVLLLNVATAGATALAVLLIGESPEIKPMVLMFLSYGIMQLETAAVCFGISAFIRGGGAGTGLGLAALFYFFNIAANLTENAGFLKYITPFGYTDSADIIVDGSIPAGYLAAGLVFTAAGIAAAFWKYGRKDIAS